jgi:hypothetical protein
MKRIGIVTLFYLFVAASTVALAGETNPRDYLPAPPGTTIMLTYVKHINADSTYHDGNKTPGFNYEQNLGFFRLVYFNTLFGMPIDYQGLFFFNDQKLNGPAVGNNQFASSGIMDPVLVSTIWPVSSPSTKTWLGFTQYITIPVGEHSKDQVLNPGGNIWVFKEELGLVQGIGDRCFFELQPSIEFHTDNDGSPHGTQSMNPLFQLQAHLSYDITPKFFVAGDYTYQHGGATRTAGVPDPDTKVDSHKAGLTFNYKLTDDYQLMFDYSKTIVTRNGPNLAIAGARFLYVF